MIVAVMQAEVAVTKIVPGIYGFFGANRFLSNFWPVDIIFDGMEYSTVEHAFQAAKTLAVDERRQIAAAATPAIAKRLGKRVALRPEWDGVKVATMEQLLRLKFHDAQLARRLIATGDLYLEETNSWNDTFWGFSVNQNRGQNVLGNLLMKIRSEIR